MGGDAGGVVEPGCSSVTVHFVPVHVPGRKRTDRNVLSLQAPVYNRTATIRSMMHACQQDPHQINKRPRVFLHGGEVLHSWILSIAFMWVSPFGKLRAIYVGEIVNQNWLAEQKKSGWRPSLLVPLCDIPSGCCFFTRSSTVTRSSLCMLRRVAAFCRPLRTVLLLMPFPRLRSPRVGVLGLCWMWQDVPFAR